MVMSSNLAPDSKSLKYSRRLTTRQIFNLSWHEEDVALIDWKKSITLGSPVLIKSSFARTTVSSPPAGKFVYRF